MSDAVPGEDNEMADQQPDLEGANEALKQTSEVAKQLVTLATAVIGGFVAAIKAQLISIAQDPTWIVGVFFAAMILVIVFSFLLQLAIAGVQDAKSFPDRTDASKEAASNPSIYASNIRGLLSLMLVAFVVSMVALSALVFF